MIRRIDNGPRMSGAVVSAGHVFISGQVADDRTVHIEGQTQQVLAKIDRYLEEAGTSRANLVMVNVFLPNILDFDAMNRVYEAWITPGSAPARATVEARLANPNLRIEISAIAAV